MNVRILTRLHHLSNHRLCQVYRRSSSWSSQSVRNAFISYFQTEHQHIHVPSSSVVPGKGQGTYFTNAGMNQFKPLFLGSVKAGSRLEGYRRVVNSQKCIRVGGKHNDLDEVGKDLTHHTFFEMLGSWSFGDYFKKEACSMALCLLTRVYGLSLDRLYFTYFGGDEQLGLLPDLECRDIWLAAGVPANQVLPFGMKDNFWDMGDTGPCGPCTEIHFDHVGGRDAAHLVNMDSPDVVEIWNLVFMQYDRQYSGDLEPLPTVHVDTGMGLERMTAVLQGSRSNYDTDLFQPLFTTICKMTGAPSYQGRTGESESDRTDQAYRIVADHTRMMCVAVADGLLPGRHGLQHKLRLVINRAIKELEDSFGVETSEGGRVLGELSQEVIQSLGATYPELQKNSRKIKQVLQLAAEQFQQLQSKAKDTQCDSPHQQTAEKRKNENDGFYRNEINQEGRTLKFELYMAKVSALHERGVAVTDDSYKYTVGARTERGYDFSSSKEINGEIVSFLRGSDLCEQASLGDLCAVILDKTCFYFQSGGQAGDTGYITTEHGLFEVLDVQEHGGYVLHIGQVVEGEMSQGNTVTMEINQSTRVGCMCNHTGTHLLNAALRSVLGDTHQMGSDVQHHKLTFDFSSLGPISVDQLLAIESSIHNQISAGHDVTCHQMALEEAVQLDGVTMMENEDYPSPVRVVRIGGELSPFQSLELCGGTHVHNTSDIGDLCVVKLTGVSQGTKRVTCVTGHLARQAVEDGVELEEKLSQLTADVMSGQDVDTWTDQVKHINTCISGYILPKLVRDSIQERLDRLGERIKAQQNKILQASLQQSVLDLLTNTSQTVAVGKMIFDSKQMVKALSGIELSKPVVLVSEGGKSSLALIAAPHQQSSMCEKLSASCKDQLRDFTIKETVAQCGKNKTVIILNMKGQGTGQKLHSVLNNLVNSNTTVS